MMTPTRLFLLVLSLALLTASAAGATAPAAPPPSAPAPTQEGLDAAVLALYRTISGPAGQSRDRAALEALFHPQVRFMFAEAAPAGGVTLRALGAEEFLRYTTPVWEAGFFEKEVARQVLQYGRVAHVWSTYETRRTESGPVVARGINSFQYFFDGQRWRLVTAYWQGERAGLPIPAEFL